MVAAGPAGTVLSCVNVRVIQRGREKFDAPEQHRFVYMPDSRKIVVDTNLWLVLRDFGVGSILLRT